MKRNSAQKGLKPMKVWIDTNVILDVLCNRPEFAEASSDIWKQCEVHNIDGYVSSLSILNIVYIMRKELTREKTGDIVRQLSMIFKVVDLKADDLTKATALSIADYEDAVQSVGASRVKAQYIVTRNIKDYTNSKVPAIKPSELLERL